MTRRRGLEAWTELHAGFIGRARPTTSRFLHERHGDWALEVFQAYDPGPGGRALADYYRHARATTTTTSPT